MMAALLGGIAASSWARSALRYGAIVLAVLLFLLALRRSGERAGRLAERLETTEKANDVQRRMLEADVRRPTGEGRPPVQVITSAAQYRAREQGLEVRAVGSSATVTGAAGVRSAQTLHPVLLGQGDLRRPPQL